MAKIEVSGSIRRVFFDGKGATLAEPYTKQDKTTGWREYTLWFNAPHGLDIGDQVSVTGVLSAKIDDWTNQDGSPKLDQSGKQGRSVTLSVNGAVATLESPKSQATVDTEDFPF